ncbi:hypothetical protein H5410_063972 [Solanum commersonii]|uniref:Uncharacterized protein n=1 Tax=Solanum commersonii TaxID=4109 RepID=A0A9J5W0Y7_SOLCO|nr:hypothetical protein H5410_063972 [Solanum commersonii]
MDWCGSSTPRTPRISNHERRRHERKAYWLVIVRPQFLTGGDTKGLCPSIPWIDREEGESFWFSCCQRVEQWRTRRCLGVLRKLWGSRNRRALILGWAYYLDAFSSYPLRTWLPGVYRGHDKLVHRGASLPGPLVLGKGPLNALTPTPDMDRTVSRTF